MSLTFSNSTLELRISHKLPLFIVGVARMKGFARNLGKTCTTRERHVIIRSMISGAILAAAVLGSPEPALADPNVPVPVELAPIVSDRFVLTVHAAGGLRTYTLPEIEKIGLYRVTTSTFWPGDDGIYEGVLMADLLKDAGLAESESILIKAVDDFSQIIPREDWESWPLLLATRRDGKPMSARNKGPLRVIYPRDMDERLADSAYRLRWVWLVKSIEPANQ